MNGKFYAVGVGPGDPDLLTVKAIKTIKDCDIIVAPKSGATKNIALQITEEYLKDKDVLELDMPMIRDEKLLDQYHDKASDEIAELLNKEKNVAFLTLGDPTIYSTVMYVHKRLKNKGYNTNIVPGIPSFCAVAASLDTTLCERNEMLHIIPASYKEVDYALSLNGNKVLMKSGKSIMGIKEKLSNKKAMMVECASMPNEKVYQSLNDLEEASSYFSVIIVKE